jgi:heat shock protein HslJ
LKLRQWISLLLTIGVVLVFAGCAGANSTPAPATVVAEAAEAEEQAEAVQELLNTSWTPEIFGGEGDAIPVIPDTYPSLHFLVERYNGFTGCDYFVGVYDLDGDTLILQTPAMTQYGCEETDLVNQGSTYTNLLWVVNRYELVDGKLHLYDAYDEPLLTMVPLEWLPFEETAWELKFISPELAYWEALIPETFITIKFDGEQLSGNSGCNDYSAPYTLSDNVLTLGEISVTDNTCDEPDGVMDQESAYLSMLATAGRLVETARSIELLTEDGTPLFMYHGE